MSSVYLIRHERLVKIGWSRNVPQRLATLDAERPGCVLLLVIDCPLARLLERALHRRFHSCRVRGEWFDIPEADLAALLALGPLAGPEELPDTLWPAPDAPPSLPRDGGSSPPNSYRFFTFRAGPDLTQRLEDVAGAFCIDTANLVRMVLSEHLHSYEERAGKINEAGIRFSQAPSPP